jgi:hypothetical protein
MYMFTLSREEVKGYYAGISTPCLHLYLIGGGPERCTLTQDAIDGLYKAHCVDRSHGVWIRYMPLLLENCRRR